MNTESLNSLFESIRNKLTRLHAQLEVEKANYGLLLNHFTESCLSDAYNRKKSLKWEETANRYKRLYKDLCTENDLFMKQLENYKQLNAIKAEQNASLDGKISSIQKMFDNCHARIICTICKNTPVNTLLKPCLHANFCQECVSKIHQCPLCREEITTSHLFYL